MHTENDKLFHFGSFFERTQAFDFIDLWQIAELALCPGGEIEAHAQICHEISYVVSGSGVFYTGDDAYEVKQGDIHVVAKGDPHRIVASPKEKLRYICIGFHFAEVPEAYRHICSFYETSPRGVANCNSDIRGLFDMLIGEFYVLQEDRAPAIAELLKLILIKVGRAFVTDALQKPTPARGIGEPGTMYRIVKFIDDNIYTVRTVSEISRELHYSESYLSTVFRQRMGVTLQTYIREKKLETAKMLLEYGNLTVNEVASLMHFDCVPSFSRNFKKKYGMTPYRYISEKTKGKNE